MKIEVKKTDVLWGYLGKIFSFINSLLLLPFVLKYLDSNAVGLWYVFLSLGGLVNLISFGFSPTFARNIAYAWSGVASLEKQGFVNVEKDSGPNWDLFGKIVGTCKWVFLGISSMAFVLLLVCGTLYVRHLTINTEVQYALSSWIIYCIGTFLNLFFGYYDSLLLGIGQVKYSNQATVWSKLLQFLLSLSLLLMGFGLLSISVAFCFSGIIFRLFARYYFLKTVKQKTDQLFSHWISFQLCQETISKVWPNTWRDGLVQFSSYLSTQATTLICSMFFTLAETGAYSIAIQIANALVSVSFSFYSSFQPSIQSAIAIGDCEKQKTGYSASICAFWGLYVVGSVFAVLIGIPIIRYFNKDLVVSMPILILILLYYLLMQNYSLSASFLSNYNSLPYVKAYVFSGIAIIILSSLSAELLPQFGIYCLIISQIVVQAIYNDWKWPKEACKKLKIQPSDIIPLGVKGIQQLIRH